MSCAKSQPGISICDLAPFLLGQQQGVFCVLGFYIDDSADAQRKTVFSVAGFIGKPDEWFEVQRAWGKVLDREGLDYFRTYECINLEGEFRKKLVDRYGLTTARVIANAVLNDLKKIVAKSPIYAYCLGVLMPDYRQVSSEPDGAIVLNKDPYIYAHHELIGGILDEVHKFPGREYVAFLYDEHSKAQLLQDSWTSFKNNNPNWATSAGTLAPLDDKIHIPIQVADLLAHTTTRVFEQFQDDPEAAKAKLKDWLKDNLMQIAYANADYLRLMVSHNVEMVKALGGKSGMTSV